MYERLKKQDDKGAAQRKKKEPRTETGNTGIPPALQRRFEDSYGVSLSDVRVHYNSEKPRDVGALAYTRGEQVCIGPGQERHLNHELGHVVQQLQSQVRPTTYINGVPVNDDPALEAQADRIGNFEI